MERLDDIRAFVAVADALSFAEASRRLSLSPAQTSKLVARLEDRLGARLLNRTARRVAHGYRPRLSRTRACPS